MAPKYTSRSILSLLPLALRAAALDTSCAPGGNFNMSYWNLQLPISTTGGSTPTIISSANLQGCSGFTDTYFYTDSSTGAIILTVPGSPSSAGCLATSGSTHCRTELREVNPSDGSNAAWDPSTSTNSLTVSMAVITPDNGSHGTAIGQVFGSSAGKPLAEMYYNTNGEIVIGVNQSPSGGSQVITDLGNVPVGTKFTYVLTYENLALSVSINGNTTALNTYSWNDPLCYFKTGNYNQGSDASQVDIYSIAVQH